VVEHLQEIVKIGDYALRKKLLKKYPATLLDVLQFPGTRPVLFLDKEESHRFRFIIPASRHLALGDLYLAGDWAGCGYQYL
jgi:hypothetical protein